MSIIVSTNLFKKTGLCRSIQKAAVLSSILSMLLFQACTKQLISKEEQNAVQNLTESMKSGNWETRKKVIELICPYDLPSTEEVIISALDDTHSIVRIDALKCLAKKKPLKAKKIIKKMAEFDLDSNVRVQAIETLGVYRDAASAPVFARGLSSEDWLIREVSVKSLLLINDLLIQQISIPYIIQALNDPRINVRLAAMENIRVKDKKIFNELSLIVNNNDNFKKLEFLKAALRALNGYILDDKTRRRLIEFLTHHPDNEVRILSLEILKKEKLLQKM